MVDIPNGAICCKLRPKTILAPPPPNPKFGVHVCDPNPGFKSVPKGHKGHKDTRNTMDTRDTRDTRGTWANGPLVSFVSLVPLVSLVSLVSLASLASLVSLVFKPMGGVAQRLPAALFSGKKGAPLSPRIIFGAL